MHIQYFPNRPGRLPSSRTHRLGIFGHTIYLYTETLEHYEFFAVDVRFPYKWNKVAKLERNEQSYTFASLSPNARFIYVMVLRGEEDLEFFVKRYDLSTKEEKLYRMSLLPNQPSIFEVPLENVIVRCGNEGEVILFDRSIVQGDIPYWLIRLDDTGETFSLTKNYIGTHGIEKNDNSALFTIAYDPANRCFAKLMGPRMMLVYTEERQKWVEYMLPPEVDLHDVFGSDGFPVEQNRVVRETYGTHGHRVGAMQTKLTFHDMDGELVARVLDTDKLHTTAIVELVHEKREIRVTKLATFSLHDSVSRMFYILATRRFHAFLGVRNNAIVYIQTPSLEELGGWKMQEMMINDGLEAEVTQVSNYNQLTALAWTKYADKEDEKMKDHLKHL